MNINNKFVMLNKTDFASSGPSDTNDINTKR